MTNNENVTEELIKLLRGREQLGYERYGGPLRVWSDRDSLQDMLEEALDLVQYTMQERLRRQAMVDEMNRLRAENTELKTKLYGESW